jgi:hypothetical protein
MSSGDSIRHTFGNVLSLYDCAPQAVLTQHRVPHPQLREVQRAIRYLGQLIEQDKEEEFCGPLLRRLRRFSFLSASTPLPFDHPLMWPEPAQLLLADAAKTYPVLFKNYTPLLRQISDGFAQLRQGPQNPLFGWLRASAAKRPEVFYGVRSDRTLMIADTRAVVAVEQLIDEFKLDLRVSTALNFQGEKSVSAQIYLGSSHWFPPWCFTAPRAPVVDLVQFDWVWDDATYPAVFGQNRAARPAVTFVRQTPIPTGVTPTRGDKTPSVACEDVFEIQPPAFDWARVIRAEERTPVDREEAQEARLFLLEGLIGVWLGNGKDDTVMSLHVDHDDKREVERVRVHDVEVGDYVLLRTEGAGDLLNDLAGHHLGDQGRTARALHLRWKKHLRARVYQLGGPTEFSRRLKALGAVKASESNLRHWQSNDNLRPLEDEDLEALIKLCDMSDQRDAIIAATDMLRSGQQTAGQHIRHLLLNSIGRADLTELQSLGCQVFEVGQGQAGGSITAFRVVNMLNKVVWVAAGRVGQPFQADQMEDG